MCCRPWLLISALPMWQWPDVCVATGAACSAATQQHLRCQPGMTPVDSFVFRSIAAKQDRGADVHQPGLDWASRLQQQQHPASQACLCQYSFAQAGVEVVSFPTTCCCFAACVLSSFMSGKSAKAVLRSASSYFPSLTKVNLYHTAGWCDPVQVRRRTCSCCVNTAAAPRPGRRSSTQRTVAPHTLHVPAALVIPAHNMH